MRPLPTAGKEYSQDVQQEVIEVVRELDRSSMRADKANFVDNGAVCVQAPNGAWFRLTTDNSGNISGTAVTVDSSGLPQQTSNPYA